ncbi:MAG: T9SS type A sorting domain-containing protein [Candidatus Latescibacterota bacterium]|nr:MAG: T9SS type A sorting domain-containing protein [Candidatus Latescibacterota bacterium]
MRTTISLLLLAILLAAPVRAQWIVQHRFPGNTLLDIELDVLFQNTKTGWIISQRDTLFRTTDGSTSWNRFATGISENLAALKFISTTHGLMVGSSGGVWRTLNGGVTWSPTTATGLSVDLTDLDYLTDAGDHAWCVGLNETIIYTPNNGVSWTNQHEGAKHLIAVDFVGSNNGWTVGTSGAILATSDGGANWISQASPAGVTRLNAVHFVSTMRGWSVGHGGTILSTIAGGAPWTQQTSGVSDDLLGVSFVDVNNGVAVGKAGTILHTIDGGATWVLERTASEDYLEVFYQNVENCWIIGRDTGNLLYSQGSLSVVSPNGGEKLEGGTRETISWTSDYVDKIRVEYTTDGTNWQFAGADAQAWDAATGSFAWDVPSDVNSTNCRVRLTGVTKPNLTDASNQTFEIFVPDSTGPMITSNPISESPQGSSILVSAQITDDVYGVGTAELHHRLAGQQTFDIAVMTLTSGDTYAATIPWQSDGIRGYQYYIRAVDASPAQNESTLPAGAPQTNPTFVAVRVSSYSRSISGSVPEDTRYQMISIPLAFDQNDGSIDSVLVDDLGPYDRKNWALFRWMTSSRTNSEFTKAPIGDFEPGRAFWLAARKNGFDTSRGVSVPPQDFTILLEPAVAGVPKSGWRQIANPFAFSVSWSDILTASGNPSGWGMPYYHDPQTNAYEIVNVLMPWTGYFFKNPALSEANLIIPPIESPSSASSFDMARPPYGSDEWTMQLVVSCNGRSDLFNYVGVSGAASRERDAEDHLEPPTIGNYIALHFPHCDWSEYADNYTTDFRPPCQEGELWNIVVTSNMPASEATLSIDGVETVPPEFDVYLFDPQFDVAQDLRENPTYRFPTPSTAIGKELTLAVASDDFFADHNLTRSDGLPDVGLDQNFPNPFNPSTIIRYALETPGRVDLEIFNVRGEVVTSLLRGVAKEPGYHVAVWNGRDSSGNAVASGVYFYRLTVGSFSEAKRMLLLK